MLVKNTGKKCIGFGTLILTPDAVGELPAGYGPEHPTVKFYIGKKWLVLVKGKTPPAEPKQASELTDEEKAAKAAEETAAQKIAEFAAKISAIGKMNQEPLRVEATNLGVEWAESDTKDVLRQKITEKLQAEMG